MTYSTRLILNIDETKSQVESPVKRGISQDVIFVQHGSKLLGNESFSGFALTYSKRYSYEL